MLTATRTGMLNSEGQFPYQRWNPQLQKLQVTTQPAISMPRMVKYSEQLLELARDQNSIMKFQSLKPADTAPVIPWLFAGLNETGRPPMLTPSYYKGTRCGTSWACN